MFRRILIATDGSDMSRIAAEKGIELAKATGAQVIALNVVNEVVIANFVRIGSDRKDAEVKLKAGGQKAVDAIKRMGDTAGVRVDTILRIGVPANDIIDVAETEKADLIVMGSHGESGATRLLIGSIVQKVTPPDIKPNPNPSFSQYF